MPGSLEEARGLKWTKVLPDFSPFFLQILKRTWRVLVT